MRRVLIVTSSYAPTMIADMQRVRQLAWELPKLGWEVEVLSPSAEYQPATCVDEDSAGFFCRIRKHIPFRKCGQASLGLPESEVLVGAPYCRSGLPASVC